MRLSLEFRSAESPRTPGLRGCLRPARSHTDTPRLVVIVIVLGLASVQTALGRPVDGTRQLLAGAGVIGLELAHRVGNGALLPIR
jgi:hypothetical protein